MYIAAKVFFITKQIQFIEKKKFAVVALDSEDEILESHVAPPTISNANKIHLFYEAQIVFLQLDEATTTVSPEYFDFIDIFSFKQIVKL